MYNRIMYNRGKDATFLTNQKERFKKLAEVSPDAAIYYRGWNYKQLTLEQALLQTVEGLTEHCYELLQQIPANFLVSFGEHIDYVDLVNKSSSYPLLEKAEFLTKYLTCLIDIVVCIKLGSPFLVIKREENQ